MTVSQLISYLQSVEQEAGDIPIVIQVNRAQAHILEEAEVVDRARCWVKEYGSEYIKRIKAVVFK